MKIFYSGTHPVPYKVLELIRSHALSHQLIEDGSISEIFLEEGKSKVIGEQAIVAYLNTMIEEVKQGWYCQCNID